MKIFIRTQSAGLFQKISNICLIPPIYKTILAFEILVLKGNSGSERGKFEGRLNWCDLAMLYVMLLRKPYSWTHLTSVADIFIVFFVQ